MPEIETLRPDVRALSGLHLWHAGFSNCSQRVRLILEEKSLPWTSHLINLRLFEHATPEYQSIHPKGLVPALVHDGRTIIDSNDIIVYLDECFPQPALGQADPNELQTLLAKSSGIQLALRTLSHELLVGDARRLDAETLARFGREHGNREFYQFLRRFSTEGFDDDHLLDRLSEIGAELASLDQRLASSTFLLSDSASLADFSWIVNVHRLDLIGYPFKHLPHLNSWFAAMRGRPSYAAALQTYEADRAPADLALRERRKRLLSILGLG